jgi:hypothetical protein
VKAIIRSQVRRAILEKILDARSLTEAERSYVVQTLIAVWSTKDELRALKRRRRLAVVERALDINRRLPLRRQTVLDFVAMSYGFGSGVALEKWLQRERKKRRRNHADKNSARMSVF